jgi:hypothetical protein
MASKEVQEIQEQRVSKEVQEQQVSKEVTASKV